MRQVQDAVGKDRLSDRLGQSYPQWENLPLRDAEGKMRASIVGVGMKEDGLCKVDDPDFGKRLISREPDALIDEKFFGHKVHWMLCGNREVPYRTGWHDFGMPFSVPYYHSDIKDAWEIVEELRKRGIILSIGSMVDGDPSNERYRISWRDSSKGEPIYGKTAPEAICKAAFQILGSSKGER